MKHLFVFLILVVIFTGCGEGFGTASSNSGSKTDPTTVLQSSYATLLTVGDFLYAINNSELTTFSLRDPKNPEEINRQDVGFDIENIFHQAGVLFIGSQQAISIFLIGPDGIPRRQSSTDYFSSKDIKPCDPVIVDGEFAYVTLSTTAQQGPCRRTIQINELRVYNVRDLSHPKLVSTLEIDKPKGLGIDGNYLFVCMATKGVAVLDKSNPQELKQIGNLESFESYDLIAHEGLLMVVCPKEIRQYDYTDIHNILYLSSIEL